MSNVQDAERLAYPRRSYVDSAMSWVSMSGLASLGVASALYLYSLHCGRKSGDLERTFEVTKLDDLRKVVLPALVAIRGRVNSDFPKKCDLCDKHAVIHEVVEEEVWRKQRAEGRTVYEPYETRKVFEECEWFVEDGSGVRVKVENALQAERLRSAMEVKTEFIGEDLSKISMGKLLLEKAWQTTKHGMRKTERYLPVGAVITCVGELDNNYIHSKTPSSSSTSGGGLAPLLGLPGSSTSGAASSIAAAAASATGSGLAGIKAGGSGSPGWGMLAGGVGGPLKAAGGGTVAAAAGALKATGLVNGEMPYVLRKPATGPCYITPLTLGQLKAAMSRTARNCRWLAYIFGAVGAALIVRKVMAQLWLRTRERRIRQRVAQVEAARKARLAEARRLRAVGPSGQAAVSGGYLGDEREDEYRGDREAGTCVVCLEEGVDMVFTSCGHMCCCMSCGITLDRCPICRLKSRAIKVYKP